LDRRIRTSLFSIAANILLVSILVTTSYLTGSLAILADAYHSFSDLIVSLTVLTSLLVRRRLERRNDHTDPVPGYWIESVVAFAVSLLILYTAYEVVTKVLSRPPDFQIRNLALGVVGVTVCIAITYFISRFKIMVGRETDSPALVADGYHSRMDMFSSIAVLLSIMGQWIGITLDSLVAVTIAVLIAITGLNLLISSFISFFRKSHIKEALDLESTFSHLNRFVGFVTERLFRRRMVLPRIDLARLHPRRWLTRRVATVLAVSGLVVYSHSGIRIVNPDEVGVRFRFGAIVAEHLGPGLHFAFPWPLETIVKVNVQRIFRIELGFRTDPTLLERLSPLLWEAKHKVKGYEKIGADSVAISGDENLVDFSLVVHYRPEDAVTHLYRVNRIDDVVRGITRSFMRQQLATERADLLMTELRPQVLERLKMLIADHVERLDLGIEIMAVYCHDVHPPLEAVSAFRDVFSAREDKVRAINEAESLRNESLPKARAEAETLLAEAEGYEVEKRLHAEGEAQKFVLTAQAFRQEPEITGYRLFLETVEQGLAGKKKYVANPRANLGGYRLWMYMPKFIPE